MSQPTAVTQIGNYELMDILGEGAMGIVYRARDTVSGQTVAIKTIKLAATVTAECKELFERFKREGIAGAALSHPNVVKVHAYGETDGIAYIVMDFVAGESLKTLNGRKGRWPLFEALDLAYQLLEALDYFHTRGIVHRDIKPSNIMVDTRNHLTVTDFGIARIENSTLTQVGTILGSPWYMSPEQITEMPIDGRSDLFSVGIILYELLTGINPFKADQLMAILDKIVIEPHAPPSSIASDLPAAIDKLFERALAKKPENRFQNGAEFRTALRQMLEEILPERSNTVGWRNDSSDPVKIIKPAWEAQPQEALPVPAHPANPRPAQSGRNTTTTANATSNATANSTTAELAALELSMRSMGSRGQQPRARALLWLVIGLSLSGIVVLMLSTSLQPEKATQQGRAETAKTNAPIATPAAPAAPDTTPHKTEPEDKAAEQNAAGDKTDGVGPASDKTTDATPVATPITATAPTQSPEEERVVSEIARQCASPQIERILLPDVNGIIRCQKHIICAWEAGAVIAMHRKLNTLLMEPADTTDYLAEISCTANLMQNIGNRSR